MGDNSLYSRWPCLNHMAIVSAVSSQLRAPAGSRFVKLHLPAWPWHYFCRSSHCGHNDYQGGLTCQQLLIEKLLCLKVPDYCHQSHRAPQTFPNEVKTLLVSAPPPPPLFLLTLLARSIFMAWLSPLDCSNDHIVIVSENLALQLFLCLKMSQQLKSS